MFSGQTFYISEIQLDEEIPLKKKIRALDGEVTKSLTKNVDYFICDSVGSAKYETAKRLNIKLVLPSFIDYAYNYREIDYSLYLKGLDGLEICTSGFKGDELNLVLDDIKALHGIPTAEISKFTDLLIYESGNITKEAKSASKKGIEIQPESYLKGIYNLNRNVKQYSIY